MVYNLGPRARRVYDALRHQILGGENGPGARLPSHTQLAEAYGVAPLTMRQVLSVLESEGLVVREHGRGTFIRERAAPTILIVDDHAISRNVLRTIVKHAGLKALEAEGPARGIALLEAHASEIILVFSDMRMPEASDGAEFIRAVRRRWPELLLVAVTGFPSDLDDLLDSRECPVMIIPKPVNVTSVEQCVKLAIASHEMEKRGSGGASR